MADGDNLIPDSEAPRSARKRYSRRSPYWEHFEQKAECRYCKAMLCADPTWDGISRMKKHYEEICPARLPKPGRQQQVLPGAPTQNVMHREQASTSKSGSDHLDQQKSAGEDQLVRMIALHGYPSSLVEDVQFGRFVGFLCPEFKMPSRDDVEDRCDALFDDEMRKLKEALRCTPGLVSLSIGEAETTWGRVVYFAAHFIDGEWNLHRRVIQVVKASDESKPSYEQILDIKDYNTDYGFAQRLHEENYDRLKETISWWGLSLKVCSVISDANLPKANLEELRNMLQDDNYLVHLSATQYKLFCGGTNICSKLDCIVVFWDFDFTMEESWRDAFQDLSLSPKKRRGISSRLRLNHPWRYDSWWYACYYALEILHDECSSTAAEIAGLAGEATFQETELTESCRTTWGTTYRAMEAISASSSPTSNLCLIELLKLRKKLHFECTKPSPRMQDSDDDDSGFHAQNLKYALDGVGKFLDESYLSLSIPLVLDPRFKLTYVEQILKHANLDPGCISEVRVTVDRLFTEYSNQGNEMDVDPSQQGHVINREGQEQEREQEHPSSEGSRTELDAYLQDETVTRNQENCDILEWWKDNCGRYPTVARMARDFLAIPTSTRPSSQQITEIANHLRRYA